MHFNDSRVGLHLVAGLVAAAVLSTSVAPAFAQAKKKPAAATGAKARGKGKKSPEDEAAEMLSNLRARLAKIGDRLRKRLRKPVISDEEAAVTLRRAPLGLTRSIESAKQKGLGDGQ